jgi:hypothetical protein
MTLFSDHPFDSEVADWKVVGQDHFQKFESVPKEFVRKLVAPSNTSKSLEFQDNDYQSLAEQLYRVDHVDLLDWYDDQKSGTHYSE